MSEPPVPRPSPGPRHAAEPDTEPGRRGHPRRWFLAGAGAAVLAGGGGVGAAFLQRDPAPEPNPAPAQLLAAIATERALLADLAATTGGAASVRIVLAQARADHVAHLRALTALAAGFDRSAGGVSSAPGVPRTTAQLREAERQASRRTTARAATLGDARLATLLASIAACEATHAELLA